MRSIFGKYLALCLAGIIIEAVILITVLIQTYQYTNGLAQSLFNTISDWAVAISIFGFIVDWAEALSVFAVCLVLVALLSNFRKYRRRRALIRLHDWAKNAILILADYRQRDASLQDSPLERYEGIRVLIDALKAHCRTTLASAQVFGGELGAKTRKAVNTLFTIEEKVEKQDESAFEDLRTLQYNLADVMISAFESAQDKKHKAIWSKEIGQDNLEENTE